MVIIRILELSGLDRIGEIDRSEEIQECYVWQNGCLHLKNVHWSVSRWTAGGHADHNVPGLIAKWRSWAEKGGTVFGAFDGEHLVAFAIYCPHLSAGVAQFAVLHVSKPYRRQGIGSALAIKVIEFARHDGKTELYVSSSNTRKTVEFYQMLGFRPTQKVNRELFELEPEDIHMTMKLKSPLPSERLAAEGNGEKTA